MQLVRGRAAIQATLGRQLRRPAIAIGNFDGVHRGHQALLATARRLADRSQGEVVALTFDPHPARVLAPKLAPPLILSLERRAELLGEAGADVVVAEPFNAAFAAIPAEAFASDVLARDLCAEHVVVGYDFSFGKGRRGDNALLEALGGTLGFGVSIVRRVSIHGLTCSSTKVREFVLEGRVEGAQVLLGRPCEITGEVVRGAGRGRGLGFPTANVRPDAELLPKPGIYACRAVILDGVQPETKLAALSIGTNPTFVENGRLTVEAHLLDFGGDLYGKRLRLEIAGRLRDEMRYDGVDALVAQIHADIARTRELLA
ncbi:MAG TPA: bifunctional riboflavin kinase/FAD synthetase [Polyangia bacterium]|nr:bifunctional riboflavin kinase/FAD synthetase [Polyangia bacterium]